MLILILVNVHYLQNIFFSFEGSMIKITPCQIRTTQDSPPWEYIHTSKTSKCNVNDNPVTQYRNFRLLKTPAATPVN